MKGSSSISDMSFESHEKKNIQENMKEASSGFSTDLEQSRSNMVGQVMAPGESSTKRGLKSRHAQMIALGGTIGTGMSTSIWFLMGISAPGQQSDFF